MEFEVKLVSVTTPVIKDESGKTLTAEDLMVYTARVSNPSNQLNLNTGPKLLKYCIDHKHWSIFEQAGFGVEITTSRAITQQIIRHRSFCFQELSLRYAQALDFVKYKARKQDIKNRQNSTDDLPSVVNDMFVKLQEQVWGIAKMAYDELIKLNVAKECARMVLPLNTQSRIYMSGSIRSWLHYLMVRTEQGVQKEHRDIALAIQDIFIQQFPHTATAMGWGQKESTV